MCIVEHLAKRLAGNMVESLHEQLPRGVVEYRHKCLEATTTIFADADEQLRECLFGHGFWWALRVCHLDHLDIPVDFCSDWLRYLPYNL